MTVAPVKVGSGSGRFKAVRECLSRLVAIPFISTTAILTHPVLVFDDSIIRLFDAGARRRVRRVGYHSYRVPQPLAMDAAADYPHLRKFQILG